MSTPSLYIREKSPSGPWRYRRIKEGRGQKTGDLTGPFFARPCVDGKQIWKPLFAETFAQARKEVAHLGNGVPVQLKEFSATQLEIPKAVNRITLADAVKTYLEQKSGKSQKTVYQYQRTLKEFQEAVGQKGRHLDEITENVLRTYKKSIDRKSTRLNSSHTDISRMPS